MGTEKWILNPEIDPFRQVFLVGNMFTRTSHWNMLVESDWGREPGRGIECNRVRNALAGLNLEAEL
jgi:hypothetical protein